MTQSSVNDRRVTGWQPGDMNEFQAGKGSSGLYFNVYFVHTEEWIGADKEYLQRTHSESYYTGP